jgi:tetratricopeptide (TPR) repeat protein
MSRIGTLLSGFERIKACDFAGALGCLEDFQNGLEIVETGKLVSLEDFMVSLIRAPSWRSLVRYWEAVCLQALGRNEDALVALEELRTSFSPWPNDTNLIAPDFIVEAWMVHHSLGGLYYGMRERGRCIEAIKAELELNPMAFDEALFLGEVLIEDGRLEEAAFALGRLVDRVEGLPGFGAMECAALRHLASVSLKSGRKDEALAFARRALDLDPESEETRGLIAGIVAI